MKNALLSGFALLFSLSLPVQADVVIVNGDGAGEGFNDPTVVSAVGGKKKRKKARHAAAALSSSASASSRDSSVGSMSKATAMTPSSNSWDTS